MSPNDRAADPDRLAAALPTTLPANWTRTDESNGLVEYRLPGDGGICTAGKVQVRPDVLGDAAVRVDFVKGCRGAGTNYYDSVDQAAEAVARTLDTALETSSARVRVDEPDA